MTRPYTTLIAVGLAWFAAGVILMWWLHVLPLWLWLALGIAVMLAMNWVIWRWETPEDRAIRLLWAEMHYRRPPYSSRSMIPPQPSQKSRP